MKKIQLFVLSVVVVLFTACHGNLWDAIVDLDARVARLEELCKEMNTNITSLQTIVSVIQENDVITSITPIEKGGKVIGYTITFAKHDPITIYNGEDGKDGANGTNGVDGKDGYTPILGVTKDSDGVYYWTLDGEWLLDADGNKLRVTGRDGKDGVDGEDGKDGVDGEDGKDGVTPQLKIEEGYWYISYDNGATWTELGKAVGEDGKDGQDGKPGADGKDGKDGDSMFTKVTYDEKNVYLTLTNGTVLTIPLGEGVWEALEGLEDRIAKLEALCKEMNTNISALQTIVSALQSNDYITAVIPVEKDGKVIGYTITFGKHNPITIYNGEDGKDGANGTNGVDGKDGYTPILGVAKDIDGVYYWTLDGEWLLDADGNKLRVTGRDGKDGVDGEDGKDGQDGTNGTNGVDGKDGVTPQLKIENGYWYISYDKGATWTELGKAVGEDGKDGIDGEDGKDGQDGQPGADGKDGQDGDSMFTSVTYDDNNVYFTLTDGSVLIVPRGHSTSDFDQTVIDNLVSSLDIDKDVIYLQNIGDKATIVATTAPFPNSKVIWSSSDETIVKVIDGVVEAISDGCVVIEIKSGALTKKCKIGVASLGKDGELPGLFSISNSAKIQFSKGNLLYNSKDKIWRFTENQYDTVPSGWIGDFGWGTSGYNNKYPTMTSTDYKDYAFGESSNDIYKTSYDWGTFNPIENGGNKAGLWHTISAYSWEYIITERVNSRNLYGVACIDGINGLVLLPDDWEKPKNINFTSGLATSSGAEYYKTINNYTIEEWNIMMTAGAVFLPITSTDKQRGYYWTGTASNGDTWDPYTLSYYFGFYSDDFVDIDYEQYSYSSAAVYRYNRYAVRLIREYVE